MYCSFIKKRYNSRNNLQYGSWFKSNTALATVILIKISPIHGKFSFTKTTMGGELMYYISCDSFSLNPSFFYK